MFIEFSCQCGHEFRTRSENSGKSIICPNCTSRQVVPESESVAVEHLSPSNREHAFGEDLEDSDVESAPPPPKRESSQLLNMLEEEEAWPIKGKRAAPKQQPKPAAKTGSSKSSSKESRRDSAGDTVRSASARSNTRNAEEALPRTEKTTRKSSSSDSYEHIPDDNIFDAEDEPLEEFSMPKSKPKRSADFDEPPKRSAKSKSGKSKKKSEPANDNSALPVIIGGMIVIGVVGFFAIPPLIAKLKEGQEVQVPKEFEKFTEQTFYFSCEVPKDWEVDAKGGQGNIPPSVRIEKGNIKITYRSSMSGAAIQDMAQAGANQVGELPDELKPVAKVHDFQREKFKEETPDYTEVGPVEKIDTGMGEGRLSEFTGSVGFGGKFYGYRVTLLTTQYQWNVVCKCKTKKEFEAYKPIFRRIIASSGR